MSSSISGVYDIVESVLNKIRKQAMQELKIAESRYDEITNEMKQSIDEQEKKRQENLEKEKHQQVAEANAQKNADKGSLRKAQKDEQNKQEVEALLALAHSKVHQINEIYEERRTLDEALECLENSIKLFGVTTQVLEQTKLFVNHTIPKEIKKTKQREEQRRVEKMAHDQLRVSLPAEDHSISFVSLNIPNVERRKSKNAWDMFIERIHILSKQQKRFLF